MAAIDRGLMIWIFFYIDFMLAHRRKARFIVIIISDNISVSTPLATGCITETTDRRKEWHHITGPSEVRHNIIISLKSEIHVISQN